MRKHPAGSETDPIGGRGPGSWGLRLAQFLEFRVTRFILAALIVISVLPIPEIETQFRPFFLLVFSLEFLARIFLLLRGYTARTRTEFCFLVIDLLAIISFMPLDAWLGLSAPRSKEVRWLRLVRLLVLLRYSRTLAKDIYSVLTRREQLQQFGFLTTGVGMLALVSAVVLTQLRIPHDYDADPLTGTESFIDRLWWSFRQIQSQDNLVTNLAVDPTLATLSLILTILGVFLVAYLIGIGTNIVDQVVLAERRRKVGYRAHTVLVGPVHESGRMIQEFVRLFHKNRGLGRALVVDLWRWLAQGDPPPRRHALPRLALLGENPTPPEFLYQPGMRWVVYREGQGTDPDSLERAGIDGAKRIILLSPTDAGLDADAVTLTRLTAVRDMNPGAHVFAELLSDESVGLALKVGGSGTFPLNVPRFLGLFLCQHLLVPGGDAVLRELLAAQGSEFYTHIFADPIEHTRLHKNAEHTVDFATLAAWSYANFGVLLAGVFVGESPQERTHHDLIPVDRLQAWLNPAAPVVTGNQVRFVAKDGQIPYRNLAGIIGVAPSYEPVRACGRALLRVAPEEFAASPSEQRVASASRLPTLTAPTLSIKHVLVIGYSPAITSLIDGIDRFIPGVHITVALSARADSHTELRDRLQEIAVLGLDSLDPESPPGHQGQTYDLPHGGTMLLFTSEGANLSRFVERVLPKQSIDAAVFLSDPESPDKDARTTLRVLRFAETLRRQSTTADPNIPVNDQLHILVELASLRRGVRLREQLMANAPHMQANKLTVTLASTDQIRGYFLVHSAFVPGITTVYESLLEDDGVELVRLLLQPDSSHEPLTMLQLIEGLAHRGVIPLAIEQTDGAIVVTPAADQEFDPQSVRAIFALAERSCLNRL